MPAIRKDCGHFYFGAFCRRERSGSPKPKSLSVAKDLRVDGAPGEIRTPDPLVRSQMLYPAELRARYNTTPETQIITETRCLTKCPPDCRYFGAQPCLTDLSRFLCPRISTARGMYSIFSAIFSRPFPAFIPCQTQRKSFSPLAIPTLCIWPTQLAFSDGWNLAQCMLQEIVDEVARNGASLKINFGQRFSWTPLAFSLQLGFKLADGSPPQAARSKPSSSQH